MNLLEIGQTVTNQEGNRNRRVLMSHPTGNQNVRNALRSLVERDMLAEFWTTVSWNSDSGWNRLLPRKLRDQLARRCFAEAPRERLRCVPSREVVRLCARFWPLKDLLSSGERPFSVIGMFRHFDGKVARRLRDLNVDAAYAYEGNALQTFRQAKTQGVRTFYELPSSHWYWEQKLLSAEAEQNPEFAGLSPQLNDSVRHLTEKDEELLLADLIFVPSQHVRGTLAGIVPEEKIRVIGYGAPPLRAVKRMCMVSGGPLKVLFAGSLSQRKGIGYLLDAIDLLGSQVELTLLGKRIGAHPRVDEACRRWRWIESLPHSEVLDLMQQADVLVLPSLSEGCALVVLEALACGLPVIVTPNTGTLESVRDGCEGFVVPICRSDAIADRLNILNHDRELLGEMSRNAQAAAARRSWETYRNDWAEAMKGAL